MKLSTTKRRYCPVTIACGAALLVACGSDSTTRTGNDDSSSLISNDDTAALSSPRELVAGTDSTELKTIIQCFCDALYRSTLLIYHFVDQKSVMMIEFDNAIASFPSTADVYLFDEAASHESIRQWINNQHSDGLFITTAEPSQTVRLDDSAVTITSSAFVETLTGFAGDEYEKHQIEFTVGNWLAADAFFINGFSDSTEVYFQTQAPSLDN